MNTANIKKYAPVARKQFRDAVVKKLTTLGISVDTTGNLAVASATDLGENVRYGQFTLPKSLAAQRQRLVKRAEKQGYEVLVEHIAYTWFNRLCAIRYMELKGYLDHGFRLLSHPQLASGFEVLDHVPEVAASLGLDQASLVAMKLAGTEEEALYRQLLLGQCYALHTAMPFLFDAVNDELELVLPDNLTRTDSILRGLVDSIPEQDWQQVEVIGWLYQFYISEKKDQVIGKVVDSEDIPAATQLFTPNWIVQYLVQNSVGRQWLQTYPDSMLKGKMPYYIEPAEQTPEVQATLAAMTPASIEPESIKVLDPACGSGHILTEAYNLLKAIYQERGYRSRDIPQLILENNLFGLDIDDRAAQLSAFALLMLARQDDRRILSRGVRLNVVALQQSVKLDVAALWHKLNLHQQMATGSSGELFAEHPPLAEANRAEYLLLVGTLQRFLQAKTLGSLIQVPQEEQAALQALLATLHGLAQQGDIAQQEAAVELIPFIQQAWILAQRYDAVVANPPYMGGKGMNSELKQFAKHTFPDSKSDLFAMFMQHAFFLLKEHGFNAQVNMQSWMFLSSFEQLRGWLLDNKTFITMAHLGARAFSQISGEVVQTTVWVINNKPTASYQPAFFRLIEGNEEEKQTALLEQENRFDHTIQDDFKKIPGAPIAYWVSGDIYSAFQIGTPLNEIASLKAGMSTGDNDLFQRYWFELSLQRIDFNKKFDSSSDKRWFPCNSGGKFRKWYGNNEVVVDWENNGERISHHKSSAVRNSRYYFKRGMTYSKISSGRFAARFKDDGFAFDDTGRCIFFKNDEDLYFSLAVLCSEVANEFLSIMSPSMSFTSNEIGNIPLLFDNKKKIIDMSKCAVALAKNDWDSSERSWDFLSTPWVIHKGETLSKTLDILCGKYDAALSDMQLIEKVINKLLIDSYKIHISDAEVLTGISSNYSDEQYTVELLSYIIGCQMGRYSLDREGLVYAHAGNQGFAELVAEGAYHTFPADNDGILPLLDNDWFDDDITARVKAFVHTVWGEAHLQENLDFIAESLCLYAIKPKKAEPALETIRRYLSTQFWKDHLKMYKKRPIYWLFSSGKQKAFECLVYLHRYNDTTLPRMRTEYVVPLLARYQGHIDQLNEEINSAGAAATSTHLKKQLTDLTKKFNELRSFDDRLRHYADRRITIDLDDGVKVNYAKFGDLLAEVKAITGHAPEEV